MRDAMFPDIHGTINIIALNLLRAHNSQPASIAARVGSLIIFPSSRNHYRNRNYDRHLQKKIIFLRVRSFQQSFKLRFKSKLRHQLTVMYISTLMGGSRRESATCDQLLTSRDLASMQLMFHSRSNIYRNEILYISRSSLHIICNSKIKLEFN